MYHLKKDTKRKKIEEIKTKEGTDKGMSTEMKIDVCLTMIVFHFIL